MKKIVTLALAIALVCSMALTSFAAFRPSVEACKHKITAVKVNGIQINLDTDPDALTLVNLGEDTDDEADKNALEEVYKVVENLKSVTAYIDAHCVSDGEVPEVPEGIDELFDFAHVFILKADEGKLRKAANLGTDVKIASLEVTFSCEHMTTATTVFHEEDVLVEDQPVISDIDTNPKIEVSAVNFGKDTAGNQSYTIELTYNEGENVSERSLFTIMAK